MNEKWFRFNDEDNSCFCPYSIRSFHRIENSTKITLSSEGRFYFLSFKDIATCQRDYLRLVDYFKLTS